MQKVEIIQKNIIVHSAGSVNLWENKLQEEHSLIFETTEHEAKVSWETVLQQKEDGLVDFILGKTDVNYLPFETVYFNVFPSHYAFAVTFLEKQLLLRGGHPAALTLPFHCAPPASPVFSLPSHLPCPNSYPPHVALPSWLLISSVTTGPPLLKT